MSDSAQASCPEHRDLLDILGLKCLPTGEVMREVVWSCAVEHTDKFFPSDV